MTWYCGVTHAGSARSGVPVSPVLRVGSGLFTSEEPNCFMNRTAEVGVFLYFSARLICCWLGDVTKRLG